MIYYTLPGYFFKRNAKAVADKLEGKTWLKLHCEVGGDEVNSQITVSTNQTDDRVELRDMVLHCLVLEVAQ